MLLKGPCVWEQRLMKSLAGGRFLVKAVAGSWGQTDGLARLSLEAVLAGAFCSRVGPDKMSQWRIQKLILN